MSLNIRYLTNGKKTLYLKRDPHYGAVALSKKFGVDRTTIHDIVNGKTWRD